MKWRFVDFDSFPAIENMAIDQAISETASLVKTPALRLYSWNEPAISVGLYEPDIVADNGTSLVRRFTGGHFIAHNQNDISYCVAIPIKCYNYSIETAKRAVANSILIGLKSLDIKATLTSKSALKVGPHRLVERASTAMGNGVYIEQGTIYYHPPKKKAKTTTFTSLSRWKYPHEKYVNAFINGFQKDKELVSEGFSKKEKGRIAHLVEHPLKIKRGMA